MDETYIKAKGLYSGNRVLENIIANKPVLHAPAIKMAQRLMFRSVTPDVFFRHMRKGIGKFGSDINFEDQFRQAVEHFAMWCPILLLSLTG